MMRKLSFPSSSPTIPLPADIPASLSDASQPFPRLIVFDLDYTLWDFWCDTHPSPPLKANAAHTAVTDRHGEVFTTYPCVPSMLRCVPSLGAGVKMGVASRTGAPGVARDLLRALHVPPPSSSSSSSTSRASTFPALNGGLNGSNGGKSIPLMDLFDAGVEAYPGSKVKHLEALHKRSSIPFDEMLFFDDEARNRDVETLGVTMKLVADGMDWDELAAGVEEWRRRRS